MGKAEKKYKVYIASPYTIGDKEENVKRQIVCASLLIHTGFVPYAPLLSAYIDKFIPIPYDYWLELDFEWIKVCDAVLRLDGESKGADLEVHFATKNKVPVFYHIIELQHYFSKKRI